MNCERCGVQVTETHICMPTLGYLEREVLRLTARVDSLEKLAGISGNLPERGKDYRVVYRWTEPKSGAGEVRFMKLTAYDAKDVHYRADLLKKPLGDPYYRILDIIPWEE